jgi:energy-coupling factor transporter ATP-binding protein EcfA2
MARLTKFELESQLLRGEELGWRDAANKKHRLKLSSAKSRRLFNFLLTSTVRKPTELPVDFVAALASTLKGDTDPADNLKSNATVAGLSVWRLRTVETLGLGGVNLFGGPRFSYDFEGESWLAEGPNGSGKSSLLGAIIWAMTSTKPRDFGEVPAGELRPVYRQTGDDSAERQLGQWAPFAAFPSEAKDFLGPPAVSVTLAFEDSMGNTAAVRRWLQDGKVAGSRSPNFDVPPILLEAGLLMPARLAAMKFGDGDNQISTSVQRLTGLDDLIAIGLLCEGLCNKAREYLAFRKKELSNSKTEFEAAISEVKIELRKIEWTFPEFGIEDTDNEEGKLAVLGKDLNQKSAQLTQVVSEDLMQDLDLKLPVTQHALAAAIIEAERDVREGLSAVAHWRSLELIRSEIDDNRLNEIREAVVQAEKDAADALAIVEKTRSDNRFQLKALAASWHVSHGHGDFDSCPLCQKSLEAGLQGELVALQTAGDAASRTFGDNQRAAIAKLTSVLPEKLKALGAEALYGSARDRLRHEIRAKFAGNPKYSQKLVKFCGLVEAALDGVPPTDCTPRADTERHPELRAICDQIALTKALVELRNWFDGAKDEWQAWWEQRVSPAPGDQTERSSVRADTTSENWTAHLGRLNEALARAEPYRLGAAALRRAWKNGKTAREIEIELAVRQEVADSIEPLKSLGSMVEAEVRGAINDLTDRMGATLKRTLISDRVQFSAAKYSKKEGVSVRASVSDNVLVDASLIVNASWMRAVLWAFIFAIREEAVEKLGIDQFPLMVLDDPQATFDDQHRHRWSQQIASLQNGPGKVQVILATHDHNFLDLIRYSGVSGRPVLVSAVGNDTGHLTIFDGEQLEKLWVRAEESKRDEDGRTYISAARVQVETVLQIMLRGEEAGVAIVGEGFVIGKCRDKLEWLHNKGTPPWDKHSIAVLAKALQKGLSPIKHMEMSHHASGARLGMAEATDVHSHLRSKLLPALIEGFRTQREHFRLHGGLNKLHVSAEILPLPDGHSEEVRKIPFQVFGRAAALTDGKFADGLIDMAEYDETSSKRIVLAQHSAYRLRSATLEPVARVGDILIVSNASSPTPNSFVVASTNEQVFARRLEFALNHTDVAVLIAQANNPRKIAAPVIAQRSTFALKKIVGVIYDNAAVATDASGNEVDYIGGSSALSHLLSGQMGLVEVVGDSAEPIALNKQYIIVRDQLSSDVSLTSLVGRPVIAEDGDG